MKNERNTSTKKTRYALAAALLVLGTILIQFESMGPRFIAVLAIVIAALLFFQPGVLERLTGVTEHREASPTGSEDG